MNDPVKNLGKKFYQLLAEREEMQDFLDDEALAGIWFWDLKNRKSIWLSQSLKKILGFKADQIVEIPKTWDELVGIENKGIICDTIDQYLSSDHQDPLEIQIPFLQADKQSILLVCNAMALADKNYLLGKLKVQSKQKETRTDLLTDFPFKKKESTNQFQSNNQLSIDSIELQAHGSKYESLIIAGGFGGWEYKVNTSELWCSKEYFDLLGYDSSTIESWGKYDVKKVWVDLLHPDDLENATAYFEQYLKNLKGVYRQNFRMKHADGRWIWISSKGRMMKETVNGQSTDLVIGTHTDISESKRLEEELYNSNQLVLQDNALLKSIINSPEDIFIVSIDTNYCYTSFSNAYKDFVLLKFGKEISIGYNILQLFTDTQLAIFKKAIDAALNGEHFQVCVSIPLLDGKLTYLENRYNPIEDEFGRVIGATVFVQDITKIKSAEESNRISELRYSSLFSGATDAIFIANTKTGFIVDANVKACELMEYSRAELIGMHQTQLHPLEELEQFAQKFRDFAEKSMHSEELNVNETFILTRNKKKVPVLITAGKSFQIGNDIFIAAYFKDITKDIEAKNNTANLLELLKTAEMVSNTGSVEFDLLNHQIIWSDEFYKILGYDPQSFVPDRESLYNHIHADDRDEFVHWQEIAMTTIGLSEPIEIRILKNDGKIAVIRTSGISFADEQGNIFKFIAVAKDSTIRNSITQELKKQNQQLKEIAWTQSHVVRAPLTRLMGLVHVLQKGIVADSEKSLYFKYMIDSAHELDGVIKEITAKTVGGN